jgi:hypothetical protein
MCPEQDNTLTWYDILLVIHHFLLRNPEAYSWSPKLDKNYMLPKNAIQTP